MANTKIVDAKTEDWDSATQSLTTPCVVHGYDMQPGDMMYVEFAPNDTAAEFQPFGQDSTIKGSGGGPVVVNPPDGVAYKLRVRFKASKNVGRASLTGASAYLMTP